VGWVVQLACCAELLLLEALSLWTSSFGAKNLAFLMQSSSFINAGIKNSEHFLRIDGRMRALTPHQPDFAWIFQECGISAFEFWIFQVDAS
ncbi:unnamed protein product, partial [Durusdinium trenchii]